MLGGDGKSDSVTFPWLHYLSSRKLWLLTVIIVEWSGESFGSFSVLRIRKETQHEMKLENQDLLLFDRF